MTRKKDEMVAGWFGRLLEILSIRHRQGWQTDDGRTWHTFDAAYEHQTGKQYIVGDDGLPPPPPRLGSPRQIIWKYRG